MIVTIFIAIDNIPFFSCSTIDVMRVNICMGLETTDFKASTGVDVGPEPPDGIVLEALVRHVQIFVDDQILVEALEESAFGVDCRVNREVFVVIVKLLGLVVRLSAVPVSQIDVVDASHSGCVSILRGDFDGQV